MTNEIVLSKVDIKKNDLENKEFWKNAHKEDEVSPEELTSGKWFRYQFKFDGLKPTIMTKKEKIA
jgi:hypothetical protein